MDEQGNSKEINETKFDIQTAISLLEDPLEFITSETISRYGQLRAAVVAGVAVLICLTFYRFLAFLFFISIGIVIGYFLSGSDLESSFFMRNVPVWLEYFNQRSRSYLIPPAHPGRIEFQGVSAELAAKISLFLDLVLRDFILFWYRQLNISHGPEFQDQIRYSLGAVIVNITQYTRRIVSPTANVELFTMLVYSSANSLIIHVREFNAFKQSKMAWKEFINDTERDPSDNLHLYSKSSFTRSSIIKRLKEISSMILAKTLPQFESESCSLRILLTEIFATSILLPLLEKYSKPEELTLLIRDFLLSCASDAENYSVPTSETTELLIRTQPNASASINLNRIHGILSNPDSFQLFMEYLETVKAPPFLRFWTNAEFFKQFHASSNPKTDSAESLRMDARSIFESHFMPKSELSIPLFSPRTISREVTSMPLTDDSVNEIVNAKNKEVIAELDYRIDHDPGVDCFDEYLVYIARILEVDHVDGFLKSELYLRAESRRQKALRESSIGSDIGESDMGSMADFQSDFDIETESSSILPTHEISMESLGDLASVTSAEESENHQEPISIQNQTLQHIISSITNCKEQLMLVNSQIAHLKQKQKLPQASLLLSPAVSENSRPSEHQLKLKKLVRTKREIERELTQLLRMVDDIEKDDGDSAVASAPIDLKDLDVTVQMQRSSKLQRGDDQGGTVSLLSKQKPPVIYQIEVQRRIVSKDSTSGWVFYRTYADFQRLDEQLKAQFKKVAQIKLPPRRKSRSLLSQFTDSASEDISPDLETYLRMLLTDQLLYESKPMQFFFRPQDIAQHDTRTSTPDLRNKLYSLIKSVPLLTMPSLGSPTKRSSTRNFQETGVPIKVETSFISNSRETSQTDLQQSSTDKPIKADESLDLDLFIDTFFALITEIFGLNDLNTWLRRQALGLLRQMLLQQSKDKAGRVYTFFASSIRDGIQSSLENFFKDNNLCWLMDYMLIDSFWPPPSRSWFAEQEQFKNAPIRNLDKDALYHESKKLLISLLSNRDYTVIGVLAPSSPIDQQSKDKAPLLSHNFNSDSSFGGSQPHINHSTSQLPGNQQASRQNGSSGGTRQSNSAYIKLAQLHLFRLAGKKHSIDGCVRILEMLQYEELNQVLWVNLLEIFVKCLFDKDRRKH